MGHGILARQPCYATLSVRLLCCLFVGTNEKNTSLKQSVG